MRGIIFHVPEDVAATPIDGEAICGAWWAVHPEEGLAFYAVPSGYYKTDAPRPQCNKNEATARLLVGKTMPGYEVRQVPVVFAAHAGRALKALLAREKEAAAEAAAAPAPGGPR
jgi:hypothetical protein